jgi:carbamoyl-phosphate synthase large subunit
MIGVDVNAINITERTESNSNNYLKNWVPSAPAEICTSTLERKKLHKNLVFLCVRPSFTLGGTGAAIVYKRRF